MEWMRDSYDLLADRRLDQLLLPGTHDSAAHTLADQPLGTSAADRFLAWLGSAFPSAVAPWTLTQHDPVYEQLCGGVRFLDLRVAWSPPPGDHAPGMSGDGAFWCAHTFACQPLKAVLQDVADFLAATSHEALVLALRPDWPHRAAFTDQPDLGERLAAAVAAGLRGRMYPPPPESVALSPVGQSDLEALSRPLGPSALAPASAPGGAETQGGGGRGGAAAGAGGQAPVAAGAAGAAAGDGAAEGMQLPVLRAMVESGRRVLVFFDPPRPPSPDLGRRLTGHRRQKSPPPLPLSSRRGGRATAAAVAASAAATATAKPRAAATPTCAAAPPPGAPRASYSCRSGRGDGRYSHAERDSGPEDRLWPGSLCRPLWAESSSPEGTVTGLLQLLADGRTRSVGRGTCWHAAAAATPTPLSVVRDLLKYGPAAAGLRRLAAELEAQELPRLLAAPAPAPESGEAAVAAAVAAAATALASERLPIAEPAQGAPPAAAALQALGSGAGGCGGGRPAAGAGGGGGPEPAGPAPGGLRGGPGGSGGAGGLLRWGRVLAVCLDHPSREALEAVWRLNMQL
ncbi:hypothetical protein HXX76_011739 [Chlamydomonas incerta]|uniref:Phosphatidylinositol-specific phospholipase C X domain-containing protein n=1 Tax=Chlamydomonas incerta TaxID=51695 RepID=A0A835SK86_CHLIN|nr:hypothetical protein HXX76_011739 [Chlamydomonas incerta]|eukprot:KAG2426512.1 hypothetical protein HXX76_011739 [Chlamydomonas incerta]